MFVGLCCRGKAWYIRRIFARSIKRRNRFAGRSWKAEGKGRKREETEGLQNSENCWRKKDRKGWKSGEEKERQRRQGDCPAGSFRRRNYQDEACQKSANCRRKSSQSRKGCKAQEREGGKGKRSSRCWKQAHVFRGKIERSQSSQIGNSHRFTGKCRQAGFLR